jgi:hypothetical protein
MATKDEMGNTRHLQKNTKNSTTTTSHNTYQSLLCKVTLCASQNLDVEGKKYKNGKIKKGSWVLSGYIKSLIT